MEDLNQGIYDIAILNPSSVDQCILNIIKKESLITYDITKKKLVQDGGNYIGILYEIDVKGRTKDKEEKSMAIFVKTMSPDHADIENGRVQLSFDRENFVYHELFKILNEIQNKAEIPEEKRYKMVKSYDETHPQAVILENIAKKGFRNWFRMDVVTLDYAEECIKQLAKFHGLSFVLEVRQTDYFRRVIKPIKHLRKSGKEYEQLCNLLMASVWKKIESSVKNDLREGELRRIMGKYIEYVSDVSDGCCLCHGDYRPSNIMYKTVNGRVTEVIPVDYQVIYYGCPVLDFIYFIYTSTDLQFRKDHLQYLKDLYHKTLTEFLKYFKISIASVFSKNRFEELYEKKNEFGLIVTLMLGPFIFVDDKNVPDLKEFKNLSLVMIDDRYKDRLYDALKEYFYI